MFCSFPSISLSYYPAPGWLFGWLQDKQTIDSINKYWVFLNWVQIQPFENITLVDIVYIRKLPYEIKNIGRNF